MLEQVFINLIKNAREALVGTSNGVITILAEKTENKILVTITDNGPGMDQQTLDNIFIPFYTSKKKGSGIGLSISRQILKQHNGSIVAQSAVDKGASFAVKLMGEGSWS
ncbi:MAG: sensor histidine kinase, partial [Cyclobacteriaceae bacterium]|nr:sensor histidine kinase [Cyclobacteriaceae bacterium]